MSDIQKVRQEAEDIKNEIHRLVEEFAKRNPDFYLSVSADSVVNITHLLSGQTLRCTETKSSFSIGLI